MELLAVICGGAVGVVQYLLLRQVILRVTGAKSGTSAVYLTVKFALYGLLAVCAFVLLRQLDDPVHLVMYFGFGFAGGMLVSSFVNFAMETAKGHRRQK